MVNNNIIIAVDGLSASGKGSLSRLLAKEFNLKYLDTGLLYRYVGFKVLKESIDISNISAIVQIAKSLELNEILNLNLEGEKIAEAASKIAKIPELREALVYLQRSFANNKDSNYKGAVLDGRDIGTTICPNANVKFFITASLQVRGERRFKQNIQDKNSITLEETIKKIEERDKRDEKINNLAINSNDYIIIDNSNLTLEETFKTAKKYCLNLLFPS